MWGSASDMWTTDEVHKFVGTGEGELGLSLLRTIIDPDSNRWSYAVANLTEAKSYGEHVRIVASPWSPPANMKSNNSTKDGGSLLAQYYDNYAVHLNSYVQYMAAQGVTIDVVSIQNEPDWSPDYDGCEWTGEQFRVFLSENAAAINGPKLMIAESLQFTRGFTDPSLNDSIVVNNFDIVGGHLYGAETAGKFVAYPLAEQKGKRIWMTEWLIHDADGSGSNIWGDGSNQAVWDETLDEVIRYVDRSMQINWSAFIWWWGRRFYSFVGDGEAAFGTIKGQVLKRGYAFSQYAKFVRPGYTRVRTATDSAVSGLSATAYQGEDKIVVVMLNRSIAEHDDVVIAIPNDVTFAQAYVTSRTADQQAVTVTLTGHYATLDNIPARSVATVVMSY
ncbi:MAG: glycoside hydrolase family 5 [Deltaproteobacteria bacterium]|nr:glycoside hydrolase family 5 [Deltaproteobacteria bacterium]